jgi:hypothetical protein
MKDQIQDDVIDHSIDTICDNSEAVIILAVIKKSDKEEVVSYVRGDIANLKIMIDVLSKEIDK